MEGFKQFFHEKNQNPLQGMGALSLAGAPIGLGRSMDAGMKAAQTTYNRMATGNAYTSEQSAQQAVQKAHQEILKIFQTELLPYESGDYPRNAWVYAQKIVNILKQLKPRSSKPSTFGSVFAVPAAAASGIYTWVRDSLHSLFGHREHEYAFLGELDSQFQTFLEALEKLDPKTSAAIVDKLVRDLTPYLQKQSR